MQSFYDLKVWQKSHQLALAVYRSSTGFPKSEQYGVTSQLRRASTSVPANTAEGCGRGGNAELARFLQIAMGSACELEYFLLLSADLGFLKTADYQSLKSQATEVKRMLTSLIAKVKG